MKDLIYIAGPYTATSAAGVEINVNIAMDAWHILRDAGFSPVCPHLSHYLHLWHWRPYEDWLAFDFDVLEHCSGLLRLPGGSAGADSEVAFANARGLPVFRGTAEEFVEKYGRRLL